METVQKGNALLCGVHEEDIVTSFTRAAIALLIG